MKIITSGSRYIDIDAYASCIAYRHLLALKGINSKAVSTAKLNESVTQNLLDLDVKLDKYFFDNIVKQNKITEIIDHHTGFESYWNEKLGENSKIEFIGAAVTIIFELYEKENLQDKIPKDIAYLMMSGILDNTLNLKAKITNNRDIIAYKKLEKISGELGDYASKYFMDCEQLIEKDLKTALENDTKIGVISKRLPSVISQLTIWNKHNFLKNKDLIFNTLNKFGNEWILNLICLKEGKSYIVASNNILLQEVKDILKGDIVEYYLECKEVWLRKEIIKVAEECP